MLGSKPQETHTNERSIRDQIWGFYEIFRFLGEKRFRGDILGNQKLLIPISCGMPARVARCSRISMGWVRGFVKNERGNECGSDERRTRRILNTHNKKVKDALLTPVIKPVQLNLTESLGEEKPYLPKGGSSSTMRS